METGLFFFMVFLLAMGVTLLIASAQIDIYLRKDNTVKSGDTIYLINEGIYTIAILFLVSFFVSVLYFTRCSCDSTVDATILYFMFFAMLGLTLLVLGAIGVNEYSSKTMDSKIKTWFITVLIIGIILFLLSITIGYFYYAEEIAIEFKIGNDAGKICNRNSDCKSGLCDFVSGDGEKGKCANSGATITTKKERRERDGESALEYVPGFFQKAEKSAQRQVAKTEQRSRELINRLEALRPEALKPKDSPKMSKEDLALQRRLEALRPEANMSSEELISQAPPVPQNSPNKKASNQSSKKFAVETKQKSPPVISDGDVFETAEQQQ